MPVHHETEIGISPFDAFERICIEVIQLEAHANAASTAMDACAPPSSESRQPFDRAHALISSTAEKAAIAVELIRELKALLNAYTANRH